MNKLIIEVNPEHGVQAIELLRAARLDFVYEEVSDEPEYADFTAVYSENDEGHWHLRSLLTPFFFEENPEAFEELVESNTFMITMHDEEDDIPTCIDGDLARAYRDAGITARHAACSQAA